MEEEEVIKEIENLKKDLFNLITDFNKKTGYYAFVDAIPYIEINKKSNTVQYLIGEIKVDAIKTIKTY